MWCISLIRGPLLRTTIWGLGVRPLSGAPIISIARKLESLRRKGAVYRGPDADPSTYRSLADRGMRPDSVVVPSPTFDASAGTKTHPKLRFKPDHQAGAGQSHSGITVRN